LLYHKIYEIDTPDWHQERSEVCLRF